MTGSPSMHMGVASTANVSTFTSVCLDPVVAIDPEKQQDNPENVDMNTLSRKQTFSQIARSILHIFLLHFSDKQEHCYKYISALHLKPYLYLVIM